MSEQFYSTIERLAPVLRSGDLRSCELDVGEQIRTLTPSPFHIVLNLGIINDPLQAARHIDHFLEIETQRFRVRAAYVEMNGFDINTDRWYFDLFAYSEDGGHEDYDWLSDWQSEPIEGSTILGLEELQGVYAVRESDRACRDARYLTSLMVVIKFQRFIESVTAHMRKLRFPLYATAHDFDFIASFAPRQVQA